MLNSKLIEIRKKLNFTQKDMAKRLSISQQAYNNYEKGKRALPNDLLTKINDMFNININWLLTGRGSMFLSDKNSHSKKDTVLIDKLSVKASAGTGITNYEIEITGKAELSVDFFKTKPNPKNLKIITVIGDSMEPTLREGDHIIIDTSQTAPIDGIYAININGEIFIKRLQFNLNGTVEIISDNKMYNTKIFNPNNDDDVYFQIIGKKVLIIQ